MHLDLPRQRCQCTAGRCSLQQRIGCGRPRGNEGRWSASRHQSDPCKLPRKPIRQRLSILRCTDVLTRFATHQAPTRETGTSCERLLSRARSQWSFSCQVVEPRHRR